MATPDDLISVEAAQIGISGTDNKFNTWIWGQHCYDANTFPWCAAFQSWCLTEIGVDMSASAAASGVFGQFPRVDDADVQPGDLVVFNWDGRNDVGWCDHIGLVEWFDHSTGYFGTIEGNTGNADGGEVARCNRNNNASYFTAFARPNYDGASSNNNNNNDTDESVIDMQCIYRPNGANHLIWFDGSYTHFLNHPDEVTAIQTVYKKCTGKDIPMFEFGSETAPWATRFAEAVERKD